MVASARARHHREGASRTFVPTDDKDKVVIGYYALAAGDIHMPAATGRLRRNMPNPISIALLARLAIHRDCQRKGLGRALFRDAVKRLLHAADTIGVCGLGRARDFRGREAVLLGAWF